MGEYSHLRDTFKYQSSVLIGNWDEERELRRTQLKDLLSKKSSGTLKLDAFHRRMGTALQEVELTKVQDDEYVHFGDVLQLVHLETGAVVAVDVGDVDVRPGENSCAATASPAVTAPCARNALILLKYSPPAGSKTPEPDYGDDVLRYGQKVRLAAHPLATGDEVNSAGGSRPLCLFSKPVSMTHFARYCRNQLVGFTYRDTFDTVWEVVTPEPGQRALSTGLEVLAGAPVLLIHSATQKPLLAENQKYPNDFGIELELSARTAANNGLKLAMEQTTKGLLKGSLPKGQHSEAFFAFMTGSKVARLPDPPSQPAAAESEALQAVVAELVSKYGSIYALERKLVTWSTQSAQLPADELVLLLRQVGLQTSDRHIAALAAMYAISQRVIDAAALLAGLRQVAGGSGSPVK